MYNGAEFSAFLLIDDAPQIKSCPRHVVTNDNSADKQYDSDARIAPEISRMTSGNLAFECCQVDTLSGTSFSDVRLV
jgi:hypothetical protein